MGPTRRQLYFLNPTPVPVRLIPLCPTHRVSPLESPPSLLPPPPHPSADSNQPIVTTNAAHLAAICAALPHDFHAAVLDFNSLRTACLLFRHLIVHIQPQSPCSLLVFSEMVVRLRLQRFGMKALPFYRIVVADARSKRDGKHIENLGTYVELQSFFYPLHHLTSCPISYDPLPDSSAAKHVVLNFDRVKYWLSVGAQPTEKVPLPRSILFSRRCCPH